MKAPIFIRLLTTDEQSQIQAGLRSSSAFMLRRCQILLASARGEHATAIAKTLGCDDQTVRNVIKGFNEHGLAVLGKRSCRPHRLRNSIPDEALPRLRELLHRSPREFGLDRGLWSLPLAAKLCFEQGLVAAPITGASVRRALKRLGVSWKRAKHWITSVRRVGAYEISVKHGRGREQRPLGQELTRSRKAKVDRSMLKKRKAEEGMYSADPQVLCA